MEKYKKFLLPVLCSLTILLAVGCGRIGPDPKDVLSKYLDNLLHGNHAEAYKYISTRDKKIKSLQVYLSEQSKVESPFAKAVTSKISYEIKDVTITKDQAKINVAITTPDPGYIVTDVLDAAFMSTFGEKKNEKEMDKMLAEKYKGKEVPMTTITQSFDLVKESDGWKVFLNWEIKKADDTK